MGKITEKNLKEDVMSAAEGSFTLRVTETDKRCSIGEKTGEQNIKEGRIPVLSCEGACIKGEIARLAANMVAEEKPYSRACHGELLSIPGSAMASWTEAAKEVVLIDGCFIRCHGRILENMTIGEKLVEFDALKIHRKYANIFDIDAVPEADRIEAAREVADHVLEELSLREEEAASEVSVLHCAS